MQKKSETFEGRLLKQAVLWVRVFVQEARFVCLRAMMAIYTALSIYKVA